MNGQLINNGLNMDEKWMEKWIENKVETDNVLEMFSTKYDMFHPTGSSAVQVGCIPLTSPIQWVSNGYPVASRVFDQWP